MSEISSEVLLQLANTLKEKINRCSGELIEIQAGPNGEPRFLSARLGMNTEKNEPILLIDVFEQENPIGHYDWMLGHDGAPLPPYANGNLYQRKSFEGHASDLQHRADHYWNTSDGVEVERQYQRQGIGSLLIVSSVLAIDEQHIPHLTIGGASPALQGLWSSFDSQNCPVDNPFPGSMNPYAPVKDWVDVEKFLKLNSQKIADVLVKFAKK